METFRHFLPDELLTKQSMANNKTVVAFPFAVFYKQHVYKQPVLGQSKTFNTQQCHYKQLQKLNLYP